MHLEKYHCLIKSTFESFRFESVGPNGIITKIVVFQPIPGFIWSGNQVINLGFGDLNKRKKKIDDSAISNNRDRDKVLATVAWTILKYCEKNGNAPIFVQGSSPARTRLYQMGLNANLTEIASLFTIYGRTDEEWDIFKPGVNYQAFLVTKK